MKEEVIVIIIVTVSIVGQQATQNERKQCMWNEHNHMTRTNYQQYRNVDIIINYCISSAAKLLLLHAHSLIIFLLVTRLAVLVFLSDIGLLLLC